MKLKLDKSVLSVKNIVLAALVLVECIIYVIFNALLVKPQIDTTYLKYAGVLLCLATAVSMIFLTREEKDAIILTGALIATAISDLFILVINDFYEIGLVTFIITQSVYFFRLYRGRKRAYISLFARFAAMGVLLGIMVPKSGMNLLLIEVCVYIVMLAGNCIDAWIICTKSIKNLLFAIGITLFLCCDICVGLDNAGMLHIELAAGLKNFVGPAIWAFYLPSQVLIVLSVNKGGLNAVRKQDDGQEVKSA